MDVVALSPVLVERLFWRRDAERWALTVIVKATFDLLPGEVRLSSQPVPIQLADAHEGGDAARSLSAPSDLVPFKARADVWLVGQAYAPYGRPVSMLTARLSVGGVDKAITVMGNRMVTGRRVGPALPFARMPLVYERAAGGPGTANPSGMPQGDRLPNLEPAQQRGEPAMVGFGPIAPTWPGRAGKPRAWRADEPLPEDLDASFFNAAPSDQQVGFFRGDETLVLEHLHPDHATMTTRLPGLVPRAFAERWRVAPEPIEMFADTLSIDTERRKLSMVWRGETALASREEPGRVLVAMTQAREPLGWEQMQELYRALAPQGGEGAATLDADEDESGDEEVEDELRSTMAVPAARLPMLPVFDDEDSADEDGDDLLSRVDPLGTSTRSFAVPGGARIPDVAPAWLATPSRLGGSLPARPATIASHVQVAPPEVQTPPQDLVWDSPGEAMQAPKLAAPAVAEGEAAPTEKGGSTVPPPLDGARTGPLPVVSTSEPASPWAQGISPMSVVGQLLPLAAPSAVMARPEPVAMEAPARARPKRVTPARAPTEAVDLVWFDPAAVARIAARFRELVDDLDMEPLDPDHDLPVDDPAGARDRHHVFGVLTRAPLTDARGVPAAVRAATDGHGRFTPPLVVVEGELTLGLDELRVLETTAACAKPLAKDNKRLQDVLASVDELIDTPLLQGAAGAGEGLLREILAAVAQSKRALPVKVLEEHVERLLLGQRTYQRRTVLGGPQLRAMVTPSRDAPPVVAYLPEVVGARLPLALRFRARVIAEVHPSADPQEAAPLALRVVALARLVALPGRA